MKSLLLTFLAFLSFGASAHSNALHLNPAQSSNKYNMQTFGKTNIPIGYYEYCQRYRERCRFETEPTTIQLTQKSWDILVSTNGYVNSEIVPMTDEEIFGVPEKWEYPDVVGHCEDYVLLKKKLLNEKGFPLGSLLVTVGRDAKGGGHAVLTVVTDRGDFILDNLEQKVLLWRDAEIYFLKRQSQDNPDTWVSLARG